LRAVSRATHVEFVFTCSWEQDCPDIPVPVSFEHPLLISQFPAHILSAWLQAGSAAHAIDSLLPPAFVQAHRGVSMAMSFRLMMTRVTLSRSKTPVAGPTCLNSMKQFSIGYLPVNVGLLLSGGSEMPPSVPVAQCSTIPAPLALAVVRHEGCDRPTTTLELPLRPEHGAPGIARPAA
jgi:hypothetical protein